jgi:hypothetical protein
MSYAVVRMILFFLAAQKAETCEDEDERGREEVSVDFVGCKLCAKSTTEIYCSCCGFPFPLSAVAKDCQDANPKGISQHLPSQVRFGVSWAIKSQDWLPSGCASGCQTYIGGFLNLGLYNAEEYICP